ncbi:MAG TPA: DUF4443 domain-containing protein [Nitrososphaera sp.]|nr:DUF4443 domain-containing protein [Nitrososphaera sp.]
MALEKVTSRYAPSRVLSFDVVHVFAALQMIVKGNNTTSRNALCEGLVLGEGTVRTLVKHLKMQGFIETSNRGTKLTAKGKSICEGLLSAIPSEMSLPKCSIALSRFNYAVLVREFGFAVGLGIEQRDAAIKMGATGATTLLFKDNKFVMPANSDDSLKMEREVRRMIVEQLNPREGDVIIIGSADNNGKTAELGAKNAALRTIFGHEKHYRHHH